MLNIFRGFDVLVHSVHILIALAFSGYFSAILIIQFHLLG